MVNNTDTQLSLSVNINVCYVLILKVIVSVPFEFTDGIGYVYFTGDVSYWSFPALA